MKKNNLSKTGLSALAVTMLGLTLVAGLFAAPTTSMAAPNYQSTAVNITTVPANGTATIKARGFCLAFGKPFPTQAMTINGVGSDKARNALNYSIDKGYAAGNAQQVQLAIWYLQDGTWHNTDNAVAQEIVTNSTTSTLPTVNAVALTDALAQKSVNVSATFVPQTSDAFYGDASVMITNTTGADLNVYLPVGTVFTVPNGGQFQDLLAYELVQAEGTPTAVATGTAAATATSEITSTVVATSTAVATLTPEPVTTITSTIAPAATVTETTPTEVATIAATTPTEVATVEVSTPTEVATVEVSTPTEVPTVEVATPTSTPVSAPLPQTGDSGTGTLLLTLLLVAVAMSALGLVMRFRLKS